jgi:hypothetical protein
LQDSEIRGAGAVYLPRYKNIIHRPVCNHGVKGELAPPAADLPPPTSCRPTATRSGLPSMTSSQPSARHVRARSAGTTALPLREIQPRIPMVTAATSVATPPSASELAALASRRADPAISGRLLVKKVAKFAKPAIMAPSLSAGLAPLGCVQELIPSPWPPVALGKTPGMCSPDEPAAVLLAVSDFATPAGATVDLQPSSSGGKGSGEDQFQGAPRPPDVLLAGTTQLCLWSSAADNEDEDDAVEEVLAPQTPPTTSKASDSCRASMGHKAEVSEGWREVLPRCSLGCLASPAPVLVPRPIPAWLHG